MNIQPPRWATRFLQWYCKPELLEDLEGDLNEYFDRHCQRVGPRRAKLIYVLDVFKFLRTYTIRKPEFLNLLIQWIMIGSYIKTSGRSIIRNKLFSAINIIGLAISMSVGLLMIAFLNDLLSYDRMHANYERIYRVNTDHREKDRQEPTHLASTSYKAGRLVKESATGIDGATLMDRGFGGDAEVGTKILPLSGHYADENFFNVFSFELLSGNVRTALKEPYTIVLTEASAKKIFGEAEPIGKSIRILQRNDTSSYTVTGVIQDIPKFSHLQFESLISYSTFLDQSETDKHFDRWDNVWSEYLYVTLSKGTTAEDFQKQLNAIAEKENKTSEHTIVQLYLQPLGNIALGPDLSNQIGPTLPVTIMYIVAGLAFVVIVSACFNYTNLSIARSLRRSREVGIRKVIGAARTHVVGQFLVEAIVISLLSLMLSFGLFLILRPHFMAIAPELARMIDLNISARLMLAFTSFAIVVGICAGMVPAFFFAKINAVQVMKDATTHRVFRNVNLRKGLIVLQYTFSIMFITATFLYYKQYKHALAFDLGFKTENVLNLDLQGNKPAILEKEIASLPEIQMMSRSLMITSVGNYYGTQIKYKGDSSIAYFNTVNENYIPLHGHKLVAGRNFSTKAGGNEDEIIVNEHLLKKLKINEPSKAVGEIITVDNKPVQIIGVLKDFHYGKVDNEMTEVMFRYSNTEAGHLNLLVKSEDWPATLAKLEKIWKQIDQVHPMQATFYDEQIAKAYDEFSAMIKIIGFLAFLAITIASLGLLGMVVFITETRLKEISIRKVLGATEGSLIYILSRGFMVLLLISAIVGLPLTYILFDQVILNKIVYHAPISAFDLFISVGIVMAVALLMIGTQTLKVARTNPAEVLKSE
jgi:putative ABC transport system permease protein